MTKITPQDVGILQKAPQHIVTIARHRKILFDPTPQNRYITTMGGREGVRKITARLWGAE
jgi:hypothetical protein